MSNKLFIGLFFLFFLFLLSFRLLQVPMGFTVDESAFGYNAALLAKTGFDENGVKYPVFVNSINHTDWRQPWTQYYLTLFFKLFGATLFNLRFSSVVLTVTSAFLLLKFSQHFFKFKTAVFSSFLFLITPVIFMHSHLALDNIMVLPFTLGWLFYFYRFQQQPKLSYIFFSGFILGLSFFSYKGMRAVVPVWSIVSIIFLFKNLRQTKPVIYFCLGLLPSLILIPILSHFYHGAIFGGARPKFSDIYNFFYPYLSHFDPTFLFIKGDDLLFHSTKIHGMFLLASAPLFLIGLRQAFIKKGFWYFIITAFFTTPLLYGTVESVHRASRIICFVPLYILIASLGFQSVKLPILKFLFILLLSVNFFDFVIYYWYDYPKLTDQIFGNMSRSLDYQFFATKAKETGLSPVVDRDIFEGLYASVYFDHLPQIIESQQLPPSNSLYLTSHGNMPGFIKINSNIPNFYLYQIP